MNPATVTSELRAASVETLYPLLAFVGTSLRGFWLLRPRPLHLLPQLRPGLQTHNVLKVDLTLLVADTQIGSAPFGRCGAKINSMSTHPREEVLPFKVYTVAGRAVTTDLDVLPSLSTEQSMV